MASGMPPANADSHERSPFVQKFVLAAHRLELNTANPSLLSRLCIAHEQQDECDSDEWN
jgi:hypothetical protein